MEGTELRSKHLNSIYKDMAEILGVEVTLLIYKHYKGLQVTFPTRLLSKDYVKELIRQEFDGRNTKELARKYEYSERWIRKIIAEKQGG
ncbi:Mor transcription activator family protein [Vallitalea okinawensis]|uniref:Mor transcription activator family protein n=1 Tax=Vallitalea okinawensis TaxID=2078660 RepID=UPI001FA829F9|nr:Mor transcription activator family protein [Vallitalea okinawensis]